MMGVPLFRQVLVTRHYKITVRALMIYLYVIDPIHDFATSYRNYSTRTIQLSVFHFFRQKRL